MLRAQFQYSSLIPGARWCLRCLLLWAGPLPPDTAYILLFHPLPFLAIHQLKPKVIALQQEVTTMHLCAKGFCFIYFLMEFSPTSL